MSGISTPAIGNITISGADGAIQDGASGSIKATVFDYTSSNPLAVRLTDTAGDYVGVGAITSIAAGDNNIGNVDVVTLPAIPAGTNNIGDVDVLSIAAGDNNIGNVDIVTVPTDPFGANADAASATGSISAKLRFIAATGIPITGTVAVTQSGTWDEVGINDSGNSITVDAPVGTPVFVRLSDGASAISTLPVSLASVPSHAVTNAGTFAVQVDGAALTALQLIDDGVYTDDTSTHSTGSSKGYGMMAVAAPTDTAINANDIGMIGMTVNREMYVSLITALPAGTAAIGKLAANSGVDIGDVDILSIAAGDNNIGNVDVVTLPALAAGTNAVGKLIPPDYDVTSHTAKAVKYYTNAGAVTDGIIWSPAAGKRWHVTTLFINVSAAATVTIEDDLVAGDNAVMKMELAANSGVAIPFGDMYPLTSGEDAADLLITTSAGNVYVTAVGYEI